MDTREKLELYTETGLLRVSATAGVPQLPAGSSAAE
jgi:hypothetical protein